MLNPATLSWLQGLTLGSIAVALFQLVRISLTLGELKKEVDTMWDWWLHEVTHLPRTPAKRPIAAKRSNPRASV